MTSTRRTERTRAVAAALATALLSLGVSAQTDAPELIDLGKGFVMEKGVFGVLPEPVVAAPGIRINGDTTGGATQSLNSLAAGESGYTAIWSDSRDGNLGLYLGILPKGEGQAVDGVPIHLPRASRQVSPSIAQFPSATRGIGGALVWTAMGGKGASATLRLFDERAPKREIFTSGPIIMGEVEPKATCQVAPVEGGTGLVSWARGDTVMAINLTHDAESGKTRTGQPYPLVDSIAGAKGQFAMSLNDKGKVLVTWNSGGQMHAQVSMMQDPGRRMNGSLGQGKVIEIVPDRSAEGAGWWVLAEMGTATGLLHLDETGGVDRELLTISNQPLKSVDLTTWAAGKGIAVLVESKLETPDPRSRFGSVVLHVMNPAGIRLTPAVGVDVLDPGAKDARDPRVAAIGAQFLVAWTDSRRDKADVYYRRMSLENQTEDARPWNQDVASSDQMHHALATSGEMGIAIWDDTRDGEARIVARSIRVSPAERTLRRSDANANRELVLGSEIFADYTGNRSTYPSVAMLESGTFLATWKETSGRASALRGQLFDQGGQRLAAAFDLDPGHGSEPKWPAAVIALPRNAGFMVLWTRTGEGPMARRLSANGKLGDRIYALSNAVTKEAGRPDLCLLDDGRLIAVWDDLRTQRPQKGQAAGKSVRVVTGRFLDALGQPKGGQLFFDPSPGGGDLDPSVAPIASEDPTKRGSFLLAWTGNDGPPRDVFARSIGSNGKPLGPPQSISVKANEQDYARAVRMPNGELYIAWEDDISGRDHCFIRRLTSDGQTMGPRKLINEVETGFVEHRYAPIIAPLVTPTGPGYLALWGDLSKGQGHDIFGKWVAQEEQALGRK